MLLEEIKKIKVGGPDEWANYMGPVMFVYFMSTGKRRTDDCSVGVPPSRRL
jgi:hypothetical protein